MSALSPVTEATFELWQRLANFSASQTDAALKYLQEWIAKEIDADNVVWIGSVRILRGALAKTDPFLGWRLRARVALRPDPPPYRHQLSQYYESEHYGKLTPTYYQRSHEAKNSTDLVVQAPTQEERIKALLVHAQEHVRNARDMVKEAHSMQEAAKGLATQVSDAWHKDLPSFRLHYALRFCHEAMHRLNPFQHHERQSLRN